MRLTSWKLWLLVSSGTSVIGAVRVVLKTSLDRSPLLMTLPALR